jgi:hypothetical protein
VPTRFGPAAVIGRPSAMNLPAADPCFCHPGRRIRFSEHARAVVACSRRLELCNVAGRWSLGPRRPNARLRPPAAPSRPPGRRAREPGHAGCGRRWPRAPRAPLLSPRDA